MNVISRFIAELVDLEEAELCELERLVRAARHRRPQRAVKARFDGPYFTNADGGLEVAAVKLLVGQPYFMALIFADAAGTAVTGPVGLVSSSDAGLTAALSADGQNVNVEITAPLAAPATLTWHDPNGVIPDATLEVDVDDGSGTGTGGGDQPGPAVSVAFGDPVEGSA